MKERGSRVRERTFSSTERRAQILYTPSRADDSVLPGTHKHTAFSSTPPAGALQDDTGRVQTLGDTGRSLAVLCRPPRDTTIGMSTAVNNGAPANGENKCYQMLRDARPREASVAMYGGAREAPSPPSSIAPPPRNAQGC